MKFFGRFSRLGVVVLVLIGISLSLPIPYIRLTPGPVFNTIGEYNNQPIMTISGTPTYPTSGELNMTTERYQCSRGTHRVV